MFPLYSKFFCFRAVDYLITLGTNASQIHLIGFSIGAHVAAYVAKAIPGIGRLTGDCTWFITSVGLEVACWPFVPKFAGSHPAETVGFLGRKNPQQAFLRRLSKTFGPMS